MAAAAKTAAKKPAKTAPKASAKKAAKPAAAPAQAEAAAPDWAPAAPAPAPAVPGPMTRAQETQWAMFLHLSALSGLVISGIGFILGPLVLWLVKKDQSAFVDRHGRAALNFQITMLIAFVVSAILILVLIGFFLLIAVGIVDIVYTIINTVKAQKGEEPSYPMSIRFLRDPAPAPQ